MNYLRRTHDKLPEVQCSPYASIHQRGLCGKGPCFQVSGHIHLCRSFLGYQHHHSSQEGTTETPIPEDPQAKPPARETTGVLLPLLHRECANVLHLCVLCQLLSSRSVQPRRGFYPPWRTYSALASSVVQPLVDASGPLYHGQIDSRTVTYCRRLDLHEYQYHNICSYIHRTLHRCYISTAL